VRLKDKVCIVTGAGGGIGKATTLLFLEEGAKVAACDISKEALESLEKEATEKGLAEGLKTFILDVTNREEVKKVVDEIYKTFGSIDVLINNAGVTKDQLLLRMREEDWDFVINVNLKGVFNMTQAVAKYMLKQGKGSIVNASSLVGVYGNIGQTNYSATKAGVIGMTKTWAKELTLRGAQIRVNAIAPGFIRTPMTEKLPQKIMEQVIERTPLKRIGEPEDVARLYLFLASDESSFITGQVIGIDGGLVI